MKLQRSAINVLLSNGRLADSQKRHCHATLKAARTCRYGQLKEAIVSVIHI